MNPVSKAVLFGGIASAASTAIAINHDEAFLGHKRSPVHTLGMGLREHVLGALVVTGVAGAGVSALRLGHTMAGIQLLAVAGGVLAGTSFGHVAWDKWLIRSGVTEVAPATIESLRDTR